MVAKLSKAMLQFEENLIGIVFLSLPVMAFMQVMLRYLLGTSISWIEELTTYMMIMAMFLGAALGVKKGGHFGVDILLHIIPGRYVDLLKAMTALISAIFIIFITYYGLLFTLNVQKFGQTTPALQIPMFIPYAIMPISGLIMAVRFLLQFKTNFQSFFSMKNRVNRP